MLASELTVFTRTGIFFSLSPHPRQSSRAMARAFKPCSPPFLFLSSLLAAAFAQNPSTNTQVPPLQWIDLSGLTSGSPPPGLKYASMGFDGTSQTVIVFGGEAAGGIATQQTYLLNLSSLAWSPPVPPNDLDSKPPSRSAAISGSDFAASNRHGHVVIGGKDTNGNPLSDAWEFDYRTQFWTQITISAGGPSARFSASGGIDLTASPVQDGSIPGPNNTFYLAGGTDNKTIFPLSDAWKFEVAGVLSPNLPNNTIGSWSKIDVGETLPSRVRQGSAVMPSAKVVAIGGCDALDFSDNLCAQQDAHVLSVSDDKDLSPPNCAVARVGPVLAPNYNTASSNFASQVFMLLGTFNNTLWDDNGGLEKGEIDVFDVGTGSWTRILPAGDPGSDGKTQSFPVPREGAVAVSSPHALVGANPSVGADILVFGGQDAQGNYLNDLWLLRGYQAALSQTNQSWSGFDGDLGTGVDASGTGVTVQYMTSCAQALTPSSSSSGSQPTSSSPSSPTGSPGQDTSGQAFPFDTSVGHKALSPVALAGTLASLVIYRLSQPAVNTTGPVSSRIGLLSVASFLGVVSYVVGIVGLVLSFSSITTNTSSTLKKRSTSSSTLRTGHGQAALIFFIGLYAALAVFFLLAVAHKRPSIETEAASERPDNSRKDSQETGFTFNGTAREKNGTVRRASSPSPAPDHDSLPPESPDTPGKRSISILGGHFFSRRRNVGERTDRRSSESGRDSMSSGPSRGFEVLNRGNRKRRLSANGLNGYPSEPIVPRSLSDLSWLERRRSVAAVGELDYALTQFHHNQGQSPTPAAGDTRSTGPLLQFPSREDNRPLLPPKFHSLLHTLLHCFILGLSAVTLVALWQRAPKAAFIVFLIWTLAFYVLLFVLSWRGIPRESILTVLLTSIRYHSHEPIPAPPSTPPSRPLSTAANDLPGDSRGPYVYHQPPYRRAMSTGEEEYMSSAEHAPDEDEEEEQRRIEQEMERRDVSIITVPKRKLWIANPS